MDSAREIIMEITILILEKSWKNHGILFFNFCGNPDGNTTDISKMELDKVTFLDQLFQIAGKYLPGNTSDISKMELDKVTFLDQLFQVAG